MTVCFLSFSFLSNEIRYSFGVLHIGIGFVSFSGNLLVFITLLSNRNLLTRSNAILASMAATDFLVGTILQPMHIMQLFFARFREECTFNTVRRMLSIIIAIASYTSIALISYDRYIRLSKSLNYSRHMTVRKVILLILLCWLIPMLFPVVKIAASGEVAMTALISVYIISNLGVTVISYSFIIRIAKKKQAEMSKTQIYNQRRNRNTYHLQAAKAVANLLICFFITTTPICCFNAVAALAPYLKRQLLGFTAYQQDLFYIIAVTCAMGNSAINPLIYFAKIPEFRNQMRKMIWRNVVDRSTLNATSSGNHSQSSND